MKLQIKDAGAWRNVISFEAVDRRPLFYHAAAVLSLAGPRVTMRVLNDDDTVLAYCEKPSHEWVKPKHGQPET